MLASQEFTENYDKYGDRVYGVIDIKISALLLVLIMNYI